MVQLKGEALLPKLGKEEIDFVFEPQRTDEKDEYGSGILFQIGVGPKGLLIIGSFLANIIIGVLNLCIRVIWG